MEACSMKVTLFVLAPILLSCTLLQAQESEKKAWEKLLENCNKAIATLKDKEVSIKRQEKAVANFEKLLSNGDKKLISQNLTWLEIMSIGAQIQISALKSCDSYQSKLSTETVQLRREKQISFDKEKEILFKVMSPADTAVSKLEDLLRRMNIAITQASAKTIETAR